MTGPIFIRTSSKNLAHPYLIRHHGQALAWITILAPARLPQLQPPTSYFFYLAPHMASIYRRRAKSESASRCRMNNHSIPLALAMYSYII